MPEQRRILENLRAQLLAGPSLRTELPEAVAALSGWKLQPSSHGAWTDLPTRTIHLCVINLDGRPFKRTTLLLVLLHELAHAMLADSDDAVMGHNSRWAALLTALEEVAVKDGLLLAGEEPELHYPAQILG